MATNTTEIDVPDDLFGDSPTARPEPPLPALPFPAIIFDIETGLLPKAEILRICGEFDPDSVELPHVGPFDPMSVKIGNLKDPAKIDAKIEEARLAHVAAQANIPTMIEQARCRYEVDLLNKAALRAETAEVLAIGFRSPGSAITPFTITPDESEKRKIAFMWNTIAGHDGTDERLIGFNIFAFDLPFLIRRSIILGTPVPSCLMTRRGRYVEWNPMFIDLAELWKCGQSSDFISLDRLSKALGFAGKNGGGADFARLWKEDRGQAIAYLRNDLEITYKCACRMLGG